MMALQLKAAGVLFALGVLSGCATVQLNAGFSDVSKTVEERSGDKISWSNGSETAGEVDKKLRSTLNGKLTADQVVQIALLNNRELQALYSNLGIAQADLIQAGLLRNPIFDAAITFPISGGRPDFELTAVMNFLDLFYIPLRKRVAAARFEEVKLRVTGAVLDFVGQTRRAFYLHQAREQMLELRETIVQALSASVEVARRLHEAGNISDLDFVRQRAPMEAAKLMLRSTEADVVQSRELLNVFLGLWGEDTQWIIDNRLPDIPPEPLETEAIERVAIERSVELANARQRIVAAGEELGYAKSTALLPDWGIGTRGERREGPWTVGPVLEFPIPLFDQGQGRTGRAGAELRRTQQEYYALAVRIRSAARLARDRLLAARDRSLYYRDVLLPLHERIVNESQLHYNAMQLGVFELLQAREQQIQTAGAYVEALRDYWLAQTDLELILSGRLPNSNGLSGSDAASQSTTERSGH
jgi:cobalt-zinc-cadmium efflux system outer membrane protein